MGQLFNFKTGQWLYVFVWREREKNRCFLDYSLCVIVYDRCIKLALPGFSERCLQTVNFTWLFHLQVARSRFMYISRVVESQKNPTASVILQPIHSHTGMWSGINCRHLCFLLKTLTTNQKPKGFLFGGKPLLVGSETLCSRNISLLFVLHTCVCASSFENSPHWGRQNKGNVLFCFFFFT